jgi:hypothetical protein
MTCCERSFCGFTYIRYSKETYLDVRRAVFKKRSKMRSLWDHIYVIRWANWTVAQLMATVNVRATIRVWMGLLMWARAHCFWA